MQSIHKGMIQDLEDSVLMLEKQIVTAEEETLRSVKYMSKDENIYERLAIQKNSTYKVLCGIEDCNREAYSNTLHAKLAFLQGYKRLNGEKLERLNDS